MSEHIDELGVSHRLIFGCGRLHGGFEAKQSARLLDAALKAGIRCFDTAPSYGVGRSEDVLGDVMCDLRDIAITTKIGIPRPQSSQTSPLKVVYRRFAKPALSFFPGLKSRLVRGRGVADNNGSYSSPVLKRHLSAIEIREQLEESLKRLRRSRIDLYLIHEPDQFFIDEETEETFRSLVSEGSIGAFGLAFGANSNENLRFGSVVQQRYFKEMPCVREDSRSSILHGVLRYAPGALGGESMTASKAIRSVLSKHPKSRIIFSSSSARQIYQLTSDPEV